MKLDDMKKRKIRLGILFGGRSAEHEVSLQSAKNIVEAIDTDKYDIVLIGIEKQGHWLLPQSAKFLIGTTNPRLLKLNRAGPGVILAPKTKNADLVSLSDHRPLETVDVIFPVLHGPYGEDGTVQGLLKLANIPYVGPDVLGSALGMDKDVQKRLLREAGIPTAPFRILRRSTYAEKDLSGIVKELGLPVFVKPANLGSSVGINKAKTKKQLAAAINEAFLFDNKVIAEEFIEGREIECSVLGNEKPIASVPGEVIPQHEFYSYEAKYIDENGALLHIPADVPYRMKKKIRELAIKAFQTLCCEGMARVDLFLKKNGQVLINEINTIPGFTSISMYPKLWDASGIPLKKLIDRLIGLAIERHERDQKLKVTYR